MYDLRFRTDVRFREVCCKEDHFYWHSSRRQLVKVMLTPFFFVLFGRSLGKGPCKWKGQKKTWQHPQPNGKVCFSAELDHGVEVIPFPSVGTALDKLERGSLLSPVQSGWFFPFRPACVFLHHFCTICTICTIPHVLT